MSLNAMEQKLLALLTPNASTPIARIAKSLYVSEATARRYVNTLAERGVVIRTHGGCMPSGTLLDANTPMYIRFANGQRDKQCIARRAAEMIPQGATVFLDSSSTAFRIVPYLRPDQGLTLITSGLKTATALAEMNLRVMCLGGTVHTANQSMNSAFAVEAIGQFHADLFFFSCDALSDIGEITDNSYEESLLRKAFMRRAQKKILLLDAAKRGRRCKYHLCMLEEIDACITNEGEEAILLPCKK